MSIKKILLKNLSPADLKKLKSIYYFRYTFNQYKKKFDERAVMTRYSGRYIINREFKTFDLVMYDSVFPNPISGFRTAEFNALLKTFKKSKLIVNPLDYPHLNGQPEDHAKDLKKLKKTHPISYKKTFRGFAAEIKNAKFFYCIFLNNIYDCLPALEKNKIKFAFTLYPGGGFDVENEVQLMKLQKVLNSEFFQGVIVNQQFTYDFIVNNFNCPPEKILYKFGCIIPQNSIASERTRKFEQKLTLNICFCAARYTKIGEDKGYDLFVDAAKKLINKGHPVKFSVIGGFNRDTIDIEGFNEYFTFHGFKKYDDLQEIFLSQDIIVSPNRPFILDKGSFDGFPLAAVVEAVLNGTVPILTDELRQNNIFSKDEVIIIHPNSDEITEQIEKLLNNPELLNSISKKAQKKFREIYTTENQLNDRIEFLKKLIYD